MSLRADLVDAPILVQASDTEYLLSLPAYDALRRRGKPVEMVVFPDEHHFLVQPIHKFVNYQRHLDWFQFWLRNVEDSAPEKLEQYKRWRKLRAKRCEWDETKDERPSYCKFAAAN